MQILRSKIQKLRSIVTQTGLFESDLKMTKLKFTIANKKDNQFQLSRIDNQRGDIAKREAKLEKWYLKNYKFLTKNHQFFETPFSTVKYVDIPTGFARFKHYKNNIIDVTSIPVGGIYESGYGPMWIWSWHLGHLTNNDATKNNINKLYTGLKDLKGAYNINPDCMIKIGKTNENIQISEKLILTSCLYIFDSTFGFRAQLNSRNLKRLNIPHKYKNMELYYLVIDINVL
jgi:hypothetical protein